MDPRHHDDNDSQGENGEIEDFEGMRRPHMGQGGAPGGYGQPQWSQGPPRGGRDGPAPSGNKFRNEVIVRGLSFKASESDIEDYFSRIGKVDSINLQRNADRTSKGVCFVRFADEQSMLDAIEKSGADFMDRKIHIEKTKPTGERVGGFGGRGGFGGPRDDFRGDRDGGRPQWDRRDDRDHDRERSRDHDRMGGSWNRGGGGVGGGQNQSKTVFVGNLNFSTGDSSLRDFFEDCGQIKDVRITSKPDGRSKGFAHVEFLDEKAAQRALKKNDEKLDGRRLKVDLANGRKRDD